MNNLKNTRVGIVGCGWLGKPLALQLIAHGCEVLGTTRSAEKQNDLNALGIPSDVMNLPDTVERISKHVALKSNVLIIAITPGFKRGDKDYSEKVKLLVKAVQANKKSRVEQIILLSSTGVYQGLNGNVDENTVVDSTIHKVAILNAAEQTVLSFYESDKTKSATVIRLAGLVGPNRHPGKFLAGKVELPNPNHAVHLIHQQDVIGIILKLIAMPEVSGIFNAVSATDSTRQKFYALAAESLALNIPQFSSESLEKDKRILGNKIRTILGYQFEYDDLIQWLKM